MDLGSLNLIGTLLFGLMTVIFVVFFAVVSIQKRQRNEEKTLSEVANNLVRYELPSCELNVSETNTGFITSNFHAHCTGESHQQALELALTGIHELKKKVSEKGTDLKTIERGIG